MLKNNITHKTLHIDRNTLYILIISITHVYMYENELFKPNYFLNMLLMAKLTKSTEGHKHTTSPISDFGCETS